MAAATAAEPQVWQGQMFITGYTSTAAETACSTDALVGDYYLVVYRPIIAGSPENGVSNDEGLTFFGLRNALHYHTADGVSFSSPGDAFVEYFSTRAESSASSTAETKFDLKIAPAKITLTTQTVTMSGFLDDWEDIAGCDITFTAALDLRVD
jgi:hypothetical protein